MCAARARPSATCASWDGSPLLKVSALELLDSSARRECSPARAQAASTARFASPATTPLWRASASASPAKLASSPTNWASTPACPAVSADLAAPRSLSPTPTHRAAPGRYAPQTAATLCSKCGSRCRSRRRLVFTSGARAAKCDSGTFQNKSGTTVCVACPVYTFQAVSSAAARAALRRARCHWGSERSTRARRIPKRRCARTVRPRTSRWWRARRSAISALPTNTAPWLLKSAWRVRATVGAGCWGVAVVAALDCVWLRRRRMRPGTHQIPCVPPARPPARRPASFVKLAPQCVRVRRGRLLRVHRSRRLRHRH
jgi:hypothetical protein